MGSNHSSNSKGKNGKKSKSKGSNNNSDNNINENISKDSLISEDKTIIKFEWKEGGNEVYISGNFEDTQKEYKMNKKEDSTFEFEIKLKNGIYKYRYKVDGQWNYSKNETTQEDNGQIYNIIDTKTYKKTDNNLVLIFENSKKVESNIKKKVNTNNTNNTNNTANTTDSNSTNKTINSQETTKRYKRNKLDNPTKGKNNYSTDIPSRSEMNPNAPAAPQYYLHTFNIDFYSNQNNIGKIKFLKQNEENLLSENNSYKKLSVLPHVIVYIIILFLVIIFNLPLELNS